ncbi:MAG: CRTAC1 family protein [Phycisphaerales bacterium]|nr:CRTAC1 family protein [Phycisphaerales bacterium]
MTTFQVCPPNGIKPKRNRSIFSRAHQFAIAISASTSCMCFAQSSISFEEYTFQAQLDDALRLISPGGRYGIMSGGGVAGDFNNDGFHDLFMLAGGGFPDYLYINKQDGTFEDQANLWGVDVMHHSFGASSVDFNNDGYLDIFVTSYGPSSTTAISGALKLYQNNGPDEQGQWSFTNVAVDAGVNRLFGSVRDGLGSGWGDIDLDGDLDLFICGYNEIRMCNRLYLNNGADSNGQYTFTDITANAGLERDGIYGFLPQLVDINNDLYPDLILIGDAGTSKLYINNQDGTFVDQTADASGIETANGMGVDVGDINNDGMLDMYVSSITFPTTQGPGNVLLVQNEQNTFTNTARENGTYNGHWGWGVLLVDLDHDGDRDIAETNGYTGLFAGTPAVIFENTNNGTSFTEVGQASGFLHNGQGRGMARMDIENDGDLDIAIFENNGRLKLFRNNLINESSPTDRNWVRITLDTSARDSLAPDGIGAMVRVVTHDQTQSHTQLLPMHCGSNHASASPIEVHAGISDASTLDIVQVAWPDGSYTTHTDIDANQILSISASSHPADYDLNGSVESADIFAYIKMFMNRDLATDHNGDFNLNFFDISAFIDDYQTAIMP